MGDNRIGTTNYDWKAWVQHEPWLMRMRLWICRQDRFNAGSSCYVSSLGLLSIPEGGEGCAVDIANAAEGSGAGDVESLLQAIVDAAWEVGIRPKKLEEPSGELKATIRHLKDLRLLLKMPARQTEAQTRVPEAITNPDDEIPF